MNPKLQRTSNYSQFVFTKQNRAVNILNLASEHKKLRESMRQYGFLPAFPMMVRSHNGRFIIVDGQHRFTFAKELGLDVYFVVDDTDVNISTLQAQRGWKPEDFARRWANEGRAEYSGAVEFADTYDIPVPMAFAMLAGTINFTNIRQRFEGGTYSITSRAFADRVASAWVDLAAANKDLKKTAVLQALWSCFLLDDFQPKRIVSAALRRPDLIQRPATREAALQLLETLYNHGRANKEPLAFMADAASKERKRSMGREKPLPSGRGMP